MLVVVLSMFVSLPLILLSTLITNVHARETPFQNVPAYAIATATTPHCVTECAITPSDAFKTKYACDVVDPVNCICGNGTRSVELRSSIAQHCYDKCDNGMIALATAILDDYCEQNKAALTTTPVPQTGPSTQPSPGITATTTPPSTVASTSASTATGSQTSAPSRNGPSPEVLTNIIGSVVGTVVGIIAIIVSIFIYKRTMRNRARSAANQNNGSSTEMARVARSNHDGHV